MTDSHLDDHDDADFEADEKARISALHKTAPEVIWLQIDDEAEQFQGWDAQTWCSDRINETDVKYVRSDEIERLQFQLARTEEALLAAQSDARSAWSSCRAADKDIERLRGQKVALLTASQAIIDRWHTPAWKDVPATAGYIQQLEHAVTEVRGV